MSKLTLEQLAEKCFSEMLEINKEKEISHEKEDFVIENFLDRCIQINNNLTKEEIDTLAFFFFKRRDD